MKRYETLFIVQSELPSEDITAIIDRYSKIITDMKGTVLKVERWGKRKLAYLIRKQARGFYILIDFAGRREIVAELERILKFDDKVLKYMSLRLSDSITAEEIEKELAGTQKAAHSPGFHHPGATHYTDNDNDHDDVRDVGSHDGGITT